MKKFLLTLFALFLTTTAHSAPRVAIIGGGVAGTKLASLLANSEIDLHIYEATDRIGGRSYGRAVRLSNGISTTINAGTQMNFSQLLKVAPELREIKDLFYTPEQNMILAAPSATEAGIGIYGIERAHDTGDTERARKIADKMVKDGLLSLLDISLSGLAGHFFKVNELDDLPFADLSKIYSSNPEWDKTNADDFLRSLTYDLQSHTAWGDLWGANQMWRKYQDAPNGEEKAQLAADILENGLYYGYLSSAGSMVTVPAQRKAYFTRAYIHNVVQSMESLVEFTDLKSMSALNFIWQLKWVSSGGKFIVARNWNKIPDFYLSKNKRANVHLSNWVQSIAKTSDGRFVLTIAGPEGAKTETFDIVINSSDTDSALAMTNFEAPELKDFLKFNTYTSTIALHMELDNSAGAIFGQNAGAALVAAPGIFKSLGGITFHTQLLGEDLKGKEISGLFAQSDTAASILAKAKQNNWTENQIGTEAKKLFVEDLRSLEQKSDSSSVTMLRESIEKGSILVTTAWDKALPHFAVGHMKKVANYRNVMGKDNYFYVGQALYGRSVIMVIAGLDRDISLIRKAIQRATH